MLDLVSGSLPPLSPASSRRDAPNHSQNDAAPRLSLIAANLAASRSVSLARIRASIRSPMLCSPLSPNTSMYRAYHARGEAHAARPGDVAIQPTTVASGRRHHAGSYRLVLDEAYEKPKMTSVAPSIAARPFQYGDGDGGHAKTAVLVHGFHLRAPNWETVVWGGGGGRVAYGYDLAIIRAKSADGAGADTHRFPHRPKRRRRGWSSRDGTAKTSRSIRRPELRARADCIRPCLFCREKNRAAWPPPDRRRPRGERVVGTALPVVERLVFPAMIAA